MAPSIRNWVPWIVAATFFMQMLDTSIMNTSLPQMARSFGVSPLDMSLGVTAYMTVFASMLPLSGWISDRFGARNVFVWAVALFTGSSVICGLSTSLAGFAASRAFQGLGAAMMTPVGRTLVLRSTPKAGLLQALSTITWPGLVAPLVGPLVGGFLTTWANWRWNFLVNAPIGLGAGVLIRRCIPSFPGERGRPFDWTGFVLSSTSLAALLHGIESLTRGGIGDLVAWTFLAWGGVGGTWAVAHLRRAPNPLLDLAPIAIPTFRVASLTAGLLTRAIVSSTPFLLPLLFQIGLGKSPMLAGILLSVYFAGNLAMVAATGHILRRLGFRKALLWNGWAIVLTHVLLLGIGPGTPVWTWGVLLFAAGLARSLQFTGFSSLAFADVPERATAAATTLSSMGVQVSMALGVTFAAAGLAISRHLGARAMPALGDFRTVLVLSAGVGFVALWPIRSLPFQAGASMTGRSATQAGADAP